LRASGGRGSIICASGAGYVPGLEGRLNPIRDGSNRTYIYIDNTAIEGGKPQPYPFSENAPFSVQDSKGNKFTLDVVSIIARSSLIEFTKN
jgi:hypothetical protein